MKHFVVVSCSLCIIIDVFTALTTTGLHSKRKKRKSDEMTLFEEKWCSKRFCWQQSWPVFDNPSTVFHSRLSKQNFIPPTLKKTVKAFQKGVKIIEIKLQFSRTRSFPQDFFVPYFLLMSKKLINELYWIARILAFCRHVQTFADEQ